MKLGLGFSTCPNDTFIFDAMVNGKVDTEGLKFSYHLADVEELNKRAFKAETDITKISYHAYSYIAESYLLLNSGSALGRNNGPLLVSKRIIRPNEVENIRIAIPGKFTTANLLLSIAWPGALDKKEHLFSLIEDLVLDGEVDAGLLIHENRFTYEKRGLNKISDLGEYWDGLTGLPIPLGGIAIKRNIPLKIAQKVDRVIKTSIEHAMNNPSSPYEFISKYAVSMDREVMDNHIKLYVNDFTFDLGPGGKEAVRKLFEFGYSKKLIPEIPEKIFVS